MLTLSQPIWLLLLLPLGIACWLWPLPTRLLTGLRAVTLFSLILAMCQPAIELPDRAGTVVVVADRSESMPAGSSTRERETIDLIQKSMSPRDRLAIVSFGHKAVVERPPQGGEFPGFAAEVGPEASSLAEGIEAALALIPSQAPGRVLVVSDGKWTGKDPAAAAAKAAGRGIPVDYRFLSRPRINDLAIRELHTPATVLPGEVYMVTTWIQSPTEQDIQFKLTTGSRTVASGKRAVEAGLTRLQFFDRALTPGTVQYEFTITGPDSDTVPENNFARALVGIRGTKPVLALSNVGAKSGLVGLLKAGKVDVLGARAIDVRWSLEQLSQFSGVLIENVMAADIGMPGMETIATWVEQTGSGLMMTGGKKSYAPGGYFGSPLERILPVSMEMRREHRKMNLAIVVALDRSGSMAVTVGGGRTKMDLANLGTAQVLDLLGPGDELGVIAVDSSPHVIVDLDTVANNQSERGTILSIDSMGGGIFVYEALVAASQMLLKANAETKHIILFSDAADSEQPGAYRDLLSKAEEAGITVSVIGLGTPSDTDARLLEDIAKLGKGNIYFTDQPSELPRIFAQDTFTVARSTFVEDETALKITGGILSVGGQSTWKAPAIGGYNLTYIRPEANLAIATVDEYQAPVIASWQAGSGRVLCYTGEADGKWAGPLATWDKAGDFHATMVRWTAGEQQPLPDEMLITQEVRDGISHIQLHLDPERQKEPFRGLPEVRILHGNPGAIPDKQISDMSWKNADQLGIVVPIRGRETVLATVVIPGLEPQTLPPVCLPYSPEFVPDQPGRGRATLDRMADLTGGSERLDLPAIWDTLIALPQFIDVAVWLIAAGLLGFLLEIFQRRTGLLSMGGKKNVPTTEAIEPEPKTTALPIIRQLVRAKSGPRPTGNRPQKKVGPVPESSPKATPTVATGETGGQIDAMREALKRAKKRRGD
jgi:Mg-chelatase subunit ChlD